MTTMTPHLNTPLRRRNSIATSLYVPLNLTLPTKPHHTASFPYGAIAASTTATTSSSSSSASSSSSSASSSSSSVDFELITTKPLSYTSLKDLLPSTAVHSPTAATPAGSEISIRNHLVKQAAWAYLQPMSTSPDSSDNHYFRRLGERISGGLVKNPIVSFLCSACGTIARCFDWLLRPIRLCFL